MANPFVTENVVNGRAASVVRESTNVSADGSVSFKVDLGKGSGRPVVIPAEEFSEFVRVINELDSVREEWADKAKAQVPTEIVETVVEFPTETE